MCISRLEHQYLYFTNSHFLRPDSGSYVVLYLGFQLLAVVGFMAHVTQIISIEVHCTWHYLCDMADAKSTPSYFLGPTYLSLPRKVQKRDI